MNTIVCTADEFETLVNDSDGTAIIVARGYMVDGAHWTPPPVEGADTEAESGV
ncbi:hypothetical protein [Streptomyces sp. NPDC088801]|uniref:hypothetical protein n=1 Tax=Streptomyces sp. NPDC088801 TaxID=3365903 RepID=UPI003806583F